jgi:hypothetical protein
MWHYIQRATSKRDCLIQSKHKCQVQLVRFYTLESHRFSYLNSNYSCLGKWQTCDKEKTILRLIRDLECGLAFRKELLWKKNQKTK